MSKGISRQISLFEDQRLDLESSIELSLASLSAYGERYRHWAIAYSGGKDSSATVAFVAWAIKSGKVAAPESLSILYADTRQELPPLQQTAVKLLNVLRNDGYNAEVVLPPLDKRFYVYMLGRGVPPPKNRFRWCTVALKVDPMMAALSNLREQAGEKLLMLTGVRIGESAARDQRIAVSCSKDSGECGQGWFQVSTPKSVADTLAPLLHWRLCHIYDWLYFEQSRHGYNVDKIAVVYGEDDARTGCIGCNLVNKDTALIRLVKTPEWAHLSPLLELKPLFRELIKAKWRIRKSEPEVRKDGKYSQNVQRLGPLTMEARAYGLERVLDIQGRASVDLINTEEEARIRELWATNTWPHGWQGDEIAGNIAIDSLRLTSRGEIAVQTLLVR
jgi:DNA sulfur modification protein DndC